MQWVNKLITRLRKPSLNFFNNRISAVQTIAVLQTFGWKHNFYSFIFFLTCLLKKFGKKSCNIFCITDSEGQMTLVCINHCKTTIHSWELGYWTLKLCCGFGLLLQLWVILAEGCSAPSFTLTNTFLLSNPMKDSSHTAAQTQSISLQISPNLSRIKWVNCHKMQHWLSTSFTSFK